MLSFSPTANRTARILIRVLTQLSKLYRYQHCEIHANISICRELCRDGSCEILGFLLQSFEIRDSLARVSNFYPHLFQSSEWNVEVMKNPGVQRTFSLFIIELFYLKIFNFWKVLRFLNEVQLKKIEPPNLKEVVCSLHYEKSERPFNES